MLASNVTAKPACLPTPAGPYVVGASSGSDSVDLSLVLPTYQEAKNIQAAL